MRKSFCCNILGKSLVENEELTRQLLTHKKVRHKTMKCDICDYSTDVITSLTMFKLCNALFVENVFRKSKVFCSIMIIFIKTLKRFSCQPCCQIFGKKCTLSFHIEIKHPDPNMPFPEWSFEICKEPFKSLKGIHELGS